jgi:predicted ATP-grasp superfamily ATP-dependent carboligase
MRVLVLDGNENQAVAAVRSLARAGYRVAVGAETTWSKAGWSTAAHERFRYPPADRDSRSFVASIVAQVANRGQTLVLPMTERTTVPISAARDGILAAGGRLVLPPHDTLLRAFDKQQTTALARTLGLEVPATTLIASDSEAERCAPQLPYPVVLKPRSSVEQLNESVRSTGAPRYARDADEFFSAWNDLRSRCRAALVQQYVDGVGVGFFALMRHGVPIAEFAHRRLRDVRPTGSGSSLRVSIAAEGPFRDAALAILRSLGWHGVAMVEFRVRPDGSPVFLEVNGRFWNSLALAIRAGIDFPALVAQLAQHREPAVCGPYQVGVHCRWLLGDLRHLIEVWRGAPAGYPGVFPSRLSTLAAVLRPVRGTCHDNFTWSDPLPELGDWLHFALRQLPRWASSKSTTEVWHAPRRPTHP